MYIYIFLLNTNETNRVLLLVKNAALILQGNAKIFCWSATVGYWFTYNTGWCSVLQAFLIF